MSDLKPCPCCGSESVIFEQYKRDGYRIKCKNCALKREQRSLCYSMEWLESKMKEGWNNRPCDKEIAQLKADKAELVAMLKRQMTGNINLVELKLLPSKHYEKDATKLADDTFVLLQKHKG